MNEDAQIRIMDFQEREIALQAEAAWRQARLEAEKLGVALVEIRGLKLVKVVPGSEPEVIGTIRRRRRVKRPLKGIAEWRQGNWPDEHTVRLDKCQQG